MPRTEQPAWIVESGIPTEALLAQIAVAKYADGLPPYRQEAIYAGAKVLIERSQLARWTGKVGFELERPATPAVAPQPIIHSHDCGQVVLT